MTSGQLFDGNLWVSSQEMLSGHLYVLSWVIVVIPGILPYLQLFVLGFMCVTSLGLM